MEVVAFVDGPAAFRLVGEMVYFDLPTGSGQINGVMAVDKFAESFGRAAEVMHEWCARRGEVVQLGPRLVA